MGVIVVNEISGLDPNEVEEVVRAGHTLIALGTEASQMLHSAMALHKGVFVLKGMTPTDFNLVEQKIRIHPDQFGLVITIEMESDFFSQQLLHTAKTRGAPIFYDLIGATKWI